MLFEELLDLALHGSTKRLRFARMSHAHKIYTTSERARKKTYI